MALELTKKGNKEKKSAGGGQKNDAFLRIVQFFEKNPFLKILIPVLLFIILAAIFFFIVFGDGILTKGEGDSGDASVNTNVTNEVDVLPYDNKVKNTDILDLIKRDPLSPDILASAKYTGYISGSSGLKIALVEIGDGDKLVLALGDTVDESEWEIAEIANDYVVFKAGSQTKKISK